MYCCLYCILLSFHCSMDVQLFIYQIKNDNIFVTFKDSRKYLCNRSKQKFSGSITIYYDTVITRTKGQRRPRTSAASSVIAMLPRRHTAPIPLLCLWLIKTPKNSPNMWRNCCPKLSADPPGKQSGGQIKGSRSRQWV